MADKHPVYPVSISHLGPGAGGRRCGRWWWGGVSHASHPTDLLCTALGGTVAFWHAPQCIRPALSTSVFSSSHMLTAFLSWWRERAANRQICGQNVGTWSHQRYEVAYWQAKQHKETTLLCSALAEPGEARRAHSGTTSSRGPRRTGAKSEIGGAMSDASTSAPPCPFPFPRCGTLGDISNAARCPPSDSCCPRSENHVYLKCRTRYSGDGEGARLCILTPAHRTRHCTAPPTPRLDTVCPGGTSCLRSRLARMQDLVMALVHPCALATACSCSCSRPTPAARPAEQAKRWEPADVEHDSGIPL